MFQTHDVVAQVGHEFCPWHSQDVEEVNVVKHVAVHQERVCPCDVAAPP